jgi:hypothetical protein
MDYLYRWSPTADDATLMSNWALSGGLEATRHYYNSAGAMVDSRKAEFKYYEKYSHVIKHYKAIDKAARNHGIDRRVLTALILFEIDDWETEFGKLGASAAAVKEAIKNKSLDAGWGASIGITQLEAYKARWMLIQEYGNKWKNATLGQVIDQMMKPAMAIHLAAAYMKH